MKNLTLFLLASLVTAHVSAGSIIVHPSNTDALDEKQISRIFLGKAKAFPSGKQAVAIALEEGTPAATTFNSSVLKKSSSQLKSYWSKLIFTGKGHPPKAVPSDAEMISLISANPNMIGFIEGAGDGSVKVVGNF